MAMNPLPPQAYTKDTLLSAYAWLQNQNPSIREMATTPDILVSLYLKATRDGDSALERPSIQNFKNELKSLAGLMGELEKEQETHLPPPSAISYQNATVARPTFQESTPTLTASQASVHPSGSAPKISASPSSASATQGLDPLTLEMLNEVQFSFNLSSPTEALRLLVKLGYLKAKKILTE